MTRRPFTQDTLFCRRDLEKRTQHCDEAQGNNSTRVLSTTKFFFGCEKLFGKKEDGSKEEERQDGADAYYIYTFVWKKRKKTPKDTQQAKDASRLRQKGK